MKLINAQGEQELIIEPATPRDEDDLADLIDEPTTCECGQSTEAPWFAHKIDCIFRYVHSLAR